MMWPRLVLLREMLSESGSIWITLDDNEVHHARAMLDQIFGEECFVGQLAWQKRTSRENRAALSPSFDHILLYSKALKDSWKLHRNLLAPTQEGYSNPDGDPRGPWASIPFSAQGYRENQVYEIVSPSGVRHSPPKGRCWSATEPEFAKLVAEDRIYWPNGGDGRPRVKQFPKDAKGLVPMTLWGADEVGTTEQSKKHLLEVFAEYSEAELSIHAPKPLELVRRIIEIATRPDSIVLDSFAGSGTTAHAVLDANKKDHGNRRFILVECEDYADTLTAERVRRVIDGYAFEGNQREELLREKITWTTLKKADALVKRAETLRAEHAPGDDAGELLETSERRFDKVEIKVTDGELVVEGVRRISEKVDGLGGEFTFCTLGEALDAEKLLSGEQLPEYAELGAWLFHLATGTTLPRGKARPADFYLGDADDRSVWMIYRPDLAFLTSADAALTLKFARHLQEAHGDRNHLVFAPAKFVSNRQLLDLGVEYASLPFALFREH
jgi:adenine-specific DNA-methyltransferase